MVFISLQSINCISQNVQPNAQSALNLYEQNHISKSYALLDSLRFAKQDSCDQLEYVIMKTDRYRVKNKCAKASKYLKSKEPKIQLCSEDDYYKLQLQKAYLSSFTDNIAIATSLLNKIEDFPNTISDSSSFGIKRLHLKSKIAKHFGQLDKCRMLISQAINIQLFRGNLTHPESSGFLRTLANSYLEEGQFEKAREYFRMERQIYTSLKGIFPQMLGAMFYNEANTHYEQLEIQEAISDYDSTLFYWAIDPPSKIYMRYVNEALGDLHYEIGNIELASKYWTRASEIKPPKNNDKTDNLPNLDTVSVHSNYKQLSNAYSDALEFRKSIYGNDHALTGECLTFVGRLNEIQKLPQKALLTYNEALGILISGFDFRKGIVPLDSLDKVDRYGFDALLGMTRIYFNLYSENKEKIFLDSAYKVSEYAFLALSKIKVTYEDSHTALFWSDFTYPLTELSLKIQHTYNIISQSNRNSKKAFQNSETSKSYLLRSILHKDKILRKGKLPKDLKNKEQKLTGALHRLKGSIRMEEKRCGDAQQAKIQVWQDELVKTQQEYASFLAEISLTHPKHFKQLYETPSLNIDHLLVELDRIKTTFISFFYGEESIYRFHSDHGEIRLIEIPLSENFVQAFDTITDQISRYQNSPQLRSSSSKLFQLLLGDLSIPDESSLVIIPDGPLYYLPWEALVTSSNPKESPAYLVEKHPISYVQSATLLAEYISTANKSCNYFLSILPEYDTPLSFSSKDILSNNKAFNIHELSDTEVTKSQIMKQAAQADIIHFAGHSSINEDNEMMSQLDLGKYEEYPLHSHEIFDMNLDAALVVLSSCHSGSGKYAHGEGIMNFSQAFQQAGSESVIMSMWNVDDKSTSDLFSKFYNALANGQSKSSALREAKMSFIKSGDPLISHPYFWASFILFGDDDPIIIRSSNWMYLIYASSIGLLILLSYYFIKNGIFRTAIVLSTPE